MYRNQQLDGSWEDWKVNNLTEAERKELSDWVNESGDAPDWLEDWAINYFVDEHCWMLDSIDPDSWLSDRYESIADVFGVEIT